MAEGTLVVSIHPPAGMSSDEFLQEIKNEVFPAVNKGPTRVGVIESWSLLQRVDNTGALDANAAYIWLITGTVLRVQPDSPTRHSKSFGRRGPVSMRRTTRAWIRPLHKRSPKMVPRIWPLCLACRERALLPSCISSCSTPLRSWFRNRR
jgi:hypothetical protein